MELKADLRNYEANIVVNPFHHHHPHVGHIKVHLRSVSKDGQPHPGSQWHSYSDSAPRLPRSQAGPRWPRAGGGDGGISPTFPISDANKLWPKTRQGTPTSQRSRNDVLKAWTYCLPRPCCSCIKKLPLALWDLWAGILLEAGDGSQRMIIVSTFRCKEGWGSDPEPRGCFADRGEEAPAKKPVYTDARWTPVPSHPDDPHNLGSTAPCSVLTSVSPNLFFPPCPETQGAFQMTPATGGKLLWTLLLSLTRLLPAH